MSIFFMKAKKACRLASAILPFIFLSAGAQTAHADAFTIPFFVVNPNPPIDTTRWYLSDGWADGDWMSCQWMASKLTSDTGNLIMNLSTPGGAVRPVGCAEPQSVSLQKYGHYEAQMKTAKGSGLNTAFFTWIGPPVGVPQHDEIDFEFLGKDPTQVQLNYWVNDKSMGPFIINLGFDATAAYHNYAFEWTKTSISWWVDGKLVYQVNGTNLPVNAQRMYLSLWSGAPSLDSWLGHFTYTGPVKAGVAWVRFVPYGG